MKKMQSILAAGALLASSVSAHAALQATFFAAGSSAQFNTFALAASTGSALCGTNHWSKKNGATLVDPRSGSILPEAGNIWIVFNNAAASGSAGGIVCYYVAADSIVGMRTYFGNATVTVAASQAGSADDNLVPYIGGTGVALPAAIQTVVNGTKLNVGVTDIRPEDAKFASNRTLTAYGTLMTGRGFTGVGYQGTVSTPWLGVPIVSSQSAAQANPVDYAFVPGDHDPITGSASIRPYAEAEVGAAPVLVFGNYSNTGAGHLGDPALAIRDINKYVLNLALLGKVGHVRDLAQVSNYPSDAALHVWIREPLSGTYNTMEFNVPNANNIAGDYAQGAGRVTGQEAGINPSNTSCTVKPCTVASGNPLYQFYTPTVGTGNGSTRGRVIGTGESISTSNSVADSLGYAFWGFSSFATSKAANLKYMTVDGVDPLYSTTNPNPSGPGILPQCPSTPCILPFDNIKSGYYPIWSKYRLVYDPTDATNLATNLVTLAQTASTTLYSDFVPATTLNVFRSHFAQVVTSSGGGYIGNNGIAPGIPETGGDMGGFVITKQDEQDFYTDSGGNQQINLKN